MMAIDSVKKAAATFALLLFAAGFFCLAPAPQNPDGAELVTAALQGAVLHPPGYPLQAWLGKLWSLLPFANPAWGYSLLCLTLQSLAAFVFVLAVGEYGGCPRSALIAATILCGFPPLFMLGVQPEKYALVLLFACLLLLERFWFLAGLALTQHFGLAIYLPLVIWRYSRRERPNWIGFSLVLAGGFLLAQASLLLLAQFGGWPDWGALRSLPDLVRHTLRTDLAFMGGTRGMGAAGGRQSALWLLVDHWPWLVLFWGAALAPAAAKLRRDRLVAVIFTCLLLGVTALWFARLPDMTALDMAYLSRYGTVVLPLIALLIGIGAASVSRRQRSFALVALVATLVTMVSNRHDLSLAGSRVLDVYREALSTTLGRALVKEPQGAVYVANSDLEPFWGVRLADGSLRFPLAGDYPWFLEQKAALLDPRIVSWTGGQVPTSTAVIINRALALSLPVVTTTPAALPVKTSWKNYGLYAESAAPGSAATVNELEQVVGAVCAAMVTFGQDTPSPERYGSLEVWASLQEPFRLLAVEQTRHRQSAAAAEAEAIHAAMTIGKKGGALQLCESFLQNRGRKVRHD